MQLKYNGDTGENFVNTLKNGCYFANDTLLNSDSLNTLCQHWLVYWSDANLARNHHANQ